MIYSQLSTLNKIQVKTNILLSKIYTQSGGKLTERISEGHLHDLMKAWDVKG